MLETDTLILISLTLSQFCIISQFRKLREQLVPTSFSKMTCHFYVFQILNLITQFYIKNVVFLYATVLWIRFQCLVFQILSRDCS